LKNALTFDVEEYFHAEALAGTLRAEEWPSLTSRVADITLHLLDLLDEAHTSATFFVLGWIAERQPDLVRRIAARGHEIACHGYGHRMIQRMSRAEFAEDVWRAKRALEDLVGEPVIGYRAPTFSVVRETWWCLDVLVNAGFRYDSSVFPIRHDRYGVPDAPRFPHRLRTAAGAEVVEFPPSTVSLGGMRLPVAGGGYFRLAPYRFTRWAIRHLNGREGQPAMVYLHPWEMDSQHPVVPVGWAARLRHTVNAGKTEGRLRRLLGEFEFASAACILSDTGLLALGGSR
jgi:polysaccharide deacetylase family protein (PEP-CTERM system associated)